KVSPDGRRVVFTATEEDKETDQRKKQKNDYRVIDENKRNQALYVKPIDTEEPVRARQLVNNKRHITWFDWAPDGQRIVYQHHPTSSADDGRMADIAEVEIGGGAANALAHGKGSASHPIYSPDGRYLAFVRGAERRDEVEGQRIVLLTRAGGALR